MAIRRNKYLYPSISAFSCGPTFTVFSNSYFVVVWPFKQELALLSKKCLALSTAFTVIGPSSKKLRIFGTIRGFFWAVSKDCCPICRRRNVGKPAPLFVKGMRLPDQQSPLFGAIRTAPRATEAGVIRMAAPPPRRIYIQ